MSTDYRSARTRAASIRSQYKDHGWSSQQISVRAKSCSLSESISVTIKAAGIPLATVREIAMAEADISRCQISGEILGGGNIFVRVRFDDDLIGPTATEIDRWIGTLPADGTLYEHPNSELAGLAVCRPDEFACQLWEGEDAVSGTTWMVAKRLAIRLIEQGIQA